MSLVLDQSEWHVIHMSEATEREELVQKVETMFGAKRFEAVKGIEVLETYSGCSHPHPPEPLSKGILGCTESQYRILKEFSLYTGAEYIGIFEDDVEFHCEKEKIEEWLQQLPPTWDIAFLGTTEHVRSSPFNDHTVKIKRFWGAHAVLFRKSCIPKVLETYDLYTNVKKKVCIPDWWYSWAIQEHGLEAYAPLHGKQFCQQKIGLQSYLTGKIRT
jgi:GR25 family glycosyltransferase involved in LPS biosynthesis